MIPANVRALLFRMVSDILIVVKRLARASWPFSLQLARHLVGGLSSLSKLAAEPSRPFYLSLPASWDNVTAQLTSCSPAGLVS